MPKPWQCFGRPRRRPGYYRSRFAWQRTAARTPRSTASSGATLKRRSAATANRLPLLARREAFVEELLAAVAIYPLTTDIAKLAGKLDAEQQKRGVVIPFADLRLFGYDHLEMGPHAARDRQGHIESVHDIGLPILLALPYAVAPSKRRSRPLPFSPDFAWIEACSRIRSSA